MDEVYNKYLDLLHNIKDPSFFKDKAAMTTNTTPADSANDYMLDLILGEENKYLSFNFPYNAKSNVERPGDVHTLKFFNTIVFLFDFQILSYS